MFCREWPRKKRAVVLIIELAMFLGVLAAAYAFAATPPQKGIDTLWIANQWRMLPKNWWLMAALSPKWTFWGTIAVFAAIRLAGPLRLDYLTPVAP